MAQARLDGLSDSPLLKLFQQTRQQGNGLLVLSSTLKGSVYRADGQTTIGRRRRATGTRWPTWSTRRAHAAERTAALHPPQAQQAAPQAPAKTRTVGS